MSGPYTSPRLADIPLPDLLTTIAQQNPKRLFVQVIREHLDTLPDSVVFTWGEVLQHAQNAAADLRERWTESLKKNDTRNDCSQTRQPGSPPITISLLASNGYQLYVNVIACVLNRWTVLLISPKNSPAAIEHLLLTSKSKLFLIEHTNMELGRTMEQAIPELISQTLSTFDPSSNRSSPSPLHPIAPEHLKMEMNLPAFFIHTSGSTGHPKIIPWSHEFMLSGARGRQRDSNELIGLPLYCGAPLVHAAGVIVYFVYAVAHGNLLNFVSSPKPKPPTASSLLAHLPFIRDGIVITIPYILEDLCNLGLDAMKAVANAVKQVSYTGAPLDVATGNSLVAAGMNLHARYGATEINCASTHLFPKRPEDWQYVYFREGYEYHFLPIDDYSPLRELIICPGTDGCPAVINSENPRGYATKDVWEPHPTIPNMWRHHSRRGDVTVLSNGEKTDNKQIETLLLQDRRILRVQVFGSGRPMNGAILQPTDASVHTSEFMAQIKSTIKNANAILPKHSKLVPELIIVATPDKLFVTTDKGTIKQKDTLAKFEQEIENAYEILEKGDTGLERSFKGKFDVADDVENFIRGTVQSVLGTEITDDADLFEHGVDSLLAIQLRAAVVSVVNKIPGASHMVPRNVVYNLPSVHLLTNYLLSCASLSPHEHQATKEVRIQQCIAKYSVNFVPYTPGSRDVQAAIVALSGSTGSAGSSMLRQLLERKDVEKIYLSNRKGTEGQVVRQTRAFTARGLDPQVLHTERERIVYLDVNFSGQKLGLTDSEYEELRDNVTHIIHAAWHLNFNLVLESYERVHVAGVRHLIDLALSSPHTKPPRFTFLSTIAAALMYRGPTQEPSVGERSGQILVPEVPIEDPSIPRDQGYGQSKYVSERMLVNAVRAGLLVTVIRIGQLSGATTNGAWAINEHIPMILRSSLALGIVPTDLPAVRWVPSDVAASAIVKQTFQSTSCLDYFAIENPFPTPWSEVVLALSNSSPKPLHQVSLVAWLEHIKQSNMDASKVPAIKLVEHYENMAHRGAPSALGWEESVKVAPELALGPIPRELLEKYVLYQRNTL